MGGANRIITTPFQVDHIPYLHRVGSRIPNIGKSLVTVGSAHIQFFPIDKESFLGRVPDRTNTDFPGSFVEHFIFR